MDRRSEHLVPLYGPEPTTVPKQSAVVDKRTSHTVAKGSGPPDYLNRESKSSPAGWIGLSRALDYNNSNTPSPQQRNTSWPKSADTGGSNRNSSAFTDERESILSHEITPIHRATSWSRPNILLDEKPARGSSPKEEPRRELTEDQKSKLPVSTKTALAENGEKKDKGKKRDSGKKGYEELDHGEKMDTKDKKRWRSTVKSRRSRSHSPSKDIEKPKQGNADGSPESPKDCDRQKEREEALGLAAKRGDVESIRALLAGGVDVNTLDHSGLTPLHRAARYGHVEASITLLDAGADINIRDPTGGTPLHWASHRGHPSVVDLLINRGCEINCTDSIQRTPLHDASMRGHAEVVSRLMRAGANVTMRDSDGRTCLDLVVNDAIRKMLTEAKRDREKSEMMNLTVALAYAATAGDYKEVFRLIDEGADVNGKDCYGLSPLHMASRYGHPDVVVTLLENDGDLESKDSLGATPLHWAAYKGNLSCVRILLSRGAQVNPKDNMGRTPLHGASLMNHTRIVAMLIAAGATETEEDEEGRTSMDLARSESVRALLHKSNARSVAFAVAPYESTDPADIKKFRLSTAAEAGDTELLQELLNAGTYPDNLDSYGQTALHRAASAGNEEALAMLLEHGATFENVDKNGVRPIHLAAQYNHEKCVEMLVNKGAKVDTRDCSGRTPLHNAVRAGGKRVTAVLLMAGADRKSKDMNGKTPYDLAPSDSLRELLLRGIQNEAHGEEDSEESLKLMKDVSKHQERLENEIPEISQEGNTEALCAAAASGDCDAVERLLKNGAKPNEPGSFRLAPLHHAARFGQMYVAQLLLRNGAEVDIRDADGATPLHWASCIGEASMVTLLLRAHAEPSAKDACQRTPLHDAACQGHKEIVEELLANGALRQVKDKSGKTPLDVAKTETIRQILRVTSSPLLPTRSLPARTISCRSAPARCVGTQPPCKPFISQPESFGVTNSRCCTSPPLHSSKPLATICPRYRPTKLPSLPSHDEHVETRRSASDVPDRNAENFRCPPCGPPPAAPPLSSPPSSSPPTSVPHSPSSSRASSRACIPSSPEHASPETQSSSQQSAREPSTKRPLCQILAPPGAACRRVTESSTRSTPPSSSCAPAPATPSTTASSPKSPTTSSSSKPPTSAKSPFSTPLESTAVDVLCAAVKEGESIETVRRLAALVTNLDSLNVHGLNALHTAARYGRMEVVCALLQSGADANARDADCATALHWASCLGHATCVALLLRRGAAVDASDCLGTTALHDAARCGRAQALAALLAAGADTTLRDAAGRTAAQLALDGLTRQTLLQVEDGGGGGGGGSEVPCHPDSDDGRDDHTRARLEKMGNDSPRCKLYPSDTYLDNTHEAKRPTVEAARYTGLRYAARASLLDVEHDVSSPEDKPSPQKRPCEVKCRNPAMSASNQGTNQTGSVDAKIPGRLSRNSSTKRESPSLQTIAAYRVSVTESSFATAISSSGVDRAGDPMYSSGEDAHLTVESRLPTGIGNNTKRRYSVEDTLYGIDSTVMHSSELSQRSAVKAQRAISAPGRSKNPGLSVSILRRNQVNVAGCAQSRTLPEVAKILGNVQRAWSSGPEPGQGMRSGLQSHEMASFSRLPRVWSSGHSTTDKLCAAARNNDAQEVHRLCAEGANVNAANRFGLTALHRAARMGNIAAASALLQCGACTDSCDRAGATPLHWAACFGHAPLATLLLQWGAPLEARNALGRTALHCAALFGRDAAARALLAAGANNTVRDMVAKTPMDVARTQSLTELLAAHRATKI